MRSSDIIADILNVLSDNKIHTMSDIACEIEVSRQTVHKYIQSLSYRYNIETFVGGINRGGVRLVGKSKVNIDYLSNSELQLIIDKLESLQDCNQNISKFVRNLSRHIEKEQSENEFRKGKSAS